MGTRGVAPREWPPGDWPLLGTQPHGCPLLAALCTWSSSTPEARSLSGNGVFALEGAVTSPAPGTTRTRDWMETE